MIRARAAFKVCRFAEDNSANVEGGEEHRQLYAEDEISEDIELGTRMHASGYKSVFVNEKLATGEVRYFPTVQWPLLCHTSLHFPENELGSESKQSTGIEMNEILRHR
jgi:hypothetical protein